MFDEKKFFEDMTSEEKTTEKTPLNLALSEEVIQKYKNLKSAMDELCEVCKRDGLSMNPFKVGDEYTIFGTITFHHIMGDLLKGYHAGLGLLELTKEDVDEMVKDSDEPDLHTLNVKLVMTDLHDMVVMTDLHDMVETLMK